nr:MAG TPA: hypothetical protein [Caudoviricetes sp.]DAM02891.1 MAG TPA: hypothetical protein [Caudoviricetes sp.]
MLANKSNRRVAYCAASGIAYPITRYPFFV